MLYHANAQKDLHDVFIDNFKGTSQEDSFNVQEKKDRPFHKIRRDSTDTILYQNGNNIPFNIGLCLPFLEDSVYSEEAFDQSFYVSNAQINGAFDFYAGAYIAFDSLRKAHDFLNLYIFDSSIDTFNIDSLLKDSNLIKMNMIIGPLFKKYFKKTIRFCDSNQIYSISPAKTAINYNSKYYRKSTAPINSYYDTIAQIITQRYDSSRQKVFITPDKKSKSFLKHKPLFDSVPNLKYISGSRPTIDEILDSSTIYVDEDTIKYLLGRLDHRILFINSTDESFVYKIFSELDRVKDFAIHFTVIGLPNWENFESIHIRYYDNFNVIFGSNFWVNYKSKEVTNFRKKYIQLFKKEPSKYAYLGFDNLFFHVNDLLHLTKNGRWKGLTTSYKMATFEENQLFKENSYFHLLQFMNGQIIKLK